MFNKAKVTISRPRGHDDGYVSIKIDDQDSGVRVVELHMDLMDFAEALLGLSCVEANVNYFIPDKFTYRLGCNKEVKNIPIIFDGLSKYDIRKEVKEGGVKVLDPFIPYEHGWELLSDGTTSKQDGKDYMITICRYKEVLNGQGNLS